MQIGESVEGYQRPNALYKEGDEDSDWIAIDTGGAIAGFHVALHVSP